MLEALGYARQPAVEPLGAGAAVPVHLSLRRDGQPFLWVLDAPFPADSEDDPLSAVPLPQQLPYDDQDLLPRGNAGRGEAAPWRELLDEHVFKLERAPRWVLFLAGSEALLIERHKWSQGKYLRFDLDDLFRRKEASALRAVAGLLHRDVLAPDTGLCLHDTLDENSHKHAYAVSSDLKHGVRRAVELLANEAVRDPPREATPGGLPGRRVLGREAHRGMSDLALSAAVSLLRRGEGRRCWRRADEVRHLSQGL